MFRGQCVVAVDLRSPSLVDSVFAAAYGRERVRRHDVPLHQAGACCPTSLKRSGRSPRSGVRLRPWSCTGRGRRSPRCRPSCFFGLFPSCRARAGCRSRGRGRMRFRGPHRPWAGIRPPPGCGVGGGPKKTLPVRARACQVGSWWRHRAGEWLLLRTRCLVGGGGIGVERSLVMVLDRLARQDLRRRGSSSFVPSSDIDERIQAVRAAVGQLANTTPSKFSSGYQKPSRQARRAGRMGAVQGARRACSVQGRTSRLRYRAGRELQRVRGPGERPDCGCDSVRRVFQDAVVICRCAVRSLPRRGSTWVSATPVSLPRSSA